MIEVYEAYAKAVKAWDRVPKEFMAVEVGGEYISYKCPKCGVCFASVYNDGRYFTFNQPLFCCGKLLR